MSEVTIKTNRHDYPILTWRDLTAKERTNFDYLDSDDRREEALFIRYRGCVYDLAEFMVCSDISPLKGWDGYSSDSYFSGVLVKHNGDCDTVKMATYYS